MSVEGGAEAPAEPAVPGCSKDILSQMGPLETLLGSLSYQDIDGVEGKSHQIRASARVFKKMKFDMTNSLNNDNKKNEKKEEPPKAEEVKPEVKKLMNSFWDTEEKNLFFEGLNEYGKDFESIHMYMHTRLKKKGVQEELIKTKSQIRTFYYRTFQHISVQCKFSELIPKNAQELYVLVNFGEMRRKLGVIGKKNIPKLNELVLNGSLSVRTKGKTVRIKTPMCRALRRLNQLDEKYDDLKLPTRVMVELRPKDMVSFLKVQSIAQNPRLKMALSLQKRLCSVLTCISNRWKSPEAIAYDKALISTNATTKDCVPDQKTINENYALLVPLLRLSPSPTTQINLPSVDISEYFTGQSICLNAYQVRKAEKLKGEVKKEELKEISENIKIEKSSEDSNRNHLVSSVNEVVNDAVNTILLLQSQDPKEEKIDPKIAINEEKLKCEREKQEKIDAVRQGWTLETSGSLTIGELYLMFGCDSKLSLDYSWDSLEAIKKEEVDEDVCASVRENNLSNSLQKLLSIAKLHCDNSKKPLIRCTCDHVCGAKNNAHFKKPMSAKVVKKNQAANSSNATAAASSSTVSVSATKNNNKVFPKSSPSCNNNSNNNIVHLFTQLKTMQRLDSKTKNVRGRSRCKQIVIERKLVPNKSESNHQIVSMDMISQDNVSDGEDEDDSVKDEIKEEGKNFTGLLLDQSNSCISGISNILREPDEQWINADVSQYSLSSLLGQLDCPSNSRSNQSGLAGDEISISQDVDAQLHTLMIESSVDYTAQFADLAAQVVDKK